MLHAELHRRAARWFAGHDAPVPALRHAADAQDWVLLGELFVTTAGPRILSADRQAMNEHWPGSRTPHSPAPRRWRPARRPGWTTPTGSPRSPP